MGLLAGVVGKIGMSILTSFLTEKVLVNLLFGLLERFAARTDNKIDDQLIKDVKEAYYKAD